MLFVLLTEQPPAEPEVSSVPMGEGGVVTDWGATPASLEPLLELPRPPGAEGLDVPPQTPSWQTALAHSWFEVQLALSPRSLWHAWLSVQ